MEMLKERIIESGQNLGGGILKVDGFVNHQVDPELMDACGREFAHRFASIGATKVLTAEISGSVTFIFRCVPAARIPFIRGVTPSLQNRANME